MSDVVFEHRLDGCRPVPLGGYLKALGVFRLFAEQADSEATGFWRDERFIVRTRLDEEALITFFTDRFSPSPIISPWNAGSGFYFRERKSDAKGADGKKIKTGVRDEATAATRTLDRLVVSQSARMEPLRAAAAAVRQQLRLDGQVAAPSDEGKARLVANTRGAVSDQAIAWIDAAATLARQGLAFPPLLGSGGNDGNLDFSTTVFQALLALIDVDTGAPTPVARSLFEAAVFDRARPMAASEAISQFASAGMGGLNAGSGFEGAPTGNLWDIVLEIEGAILISSSTARRLGASNAAGGAFPFMTPRGGALAAGSGAVGIGDEGTARGEFWSPIWSRPAGIDELAALFREGRAVVGGRGVRNSLDFARAIARLGVSRGLDTFDRHAFEQRNGNMYVGVTLPRRRVLSQSIPDLIADLDQGRWLDSVRQSFRDKAGAASLQIVAGRLDDALYRLAGDASPESVQQALIAIGAAALACSVRPSLRAASKDGRTLGPPPRLHRRWRTLADDGEAEFALAAALAGLSSATEPDNKGRVVRLPFRAHLAPLAVSERWDDWDESTSAHALVVWTGRDLYRDMAAVLERRLVEAQRRTFVRRMPRASGKGSDPPELPLHGQPIAPLRAVAAFMAGRTDPVRIAALAAGLAWVKPGPLAYREGRLSREDPLPYAYAALRPLLRPNGVLAGDELAMLLAQATEETETAIESKRVDPLPIVRLVMAGREADAVRRARGLAAGASLRAPFTLEPSRHSTDGLAAALLFPISERAYARLTDRAYPDLSRDREEPADAA